MMNNMSFMDPRNLMSNMYDNGYQGQRLQEPVAVLTKERVMEYLDDPEKYNCCIVLRYPQSIQRSYDRERRYAHPGACVALTGNGWKNYKNSICRQYCHPTTSHAFNGYEIVGFISIPNSAVDEERKPIPAVSSTCLSDDPGVVFAHEGTTRLYTRSKSNKQFLTLRLSFGIRFGPNQMKDIPFGDLRSENIKIISKKSKRKQIKSTDFDAVIIKSGDTVALHRANPQGKLYMYFDPKTDTFKPSMQNWSLFEIHVIDQNTKSDPVNFERVNTTVRYGSLVKLVEVDSGKTFPLFRIRGLNDVPKAKDSNCVSKAKDKDNVEAEKTKMTASYCQNIDEPVSLCHNCAFEFVFKNPGKYLSSTRDKFMIEDAVQITDKYHHVVEAACKWTIVTVNRQECVFAPLMGAPVLPVAPFPLIATADAHKDLKTGGYVGEFTGEHFRKDLCLYFGTVKLRPFQISSICLSFVIPDYDACFEEPYVMVSKKSKKMISEILLVRESDGVVYPTGVYFQHSSDQIRLGSFISSEDLVGDELTKVYRDDQSDTSSISYNSSSNTIVSTTSSDSTSDLSHSDTCGSTLFDQSDDYRYVGNFDYRYM